MKKTSKKAKARHTAPNRAARFAARAAQTLARPQAEHAKEIRAERFTLVDADGKDRARLTVCGDEAVLAMRDARGALRLTLRASEREASITIYRGAAGDEIESVTVGYEP